MEDLLSFISLPHTRAELQQGDDNDGSYPRWFNSKECIFSNGSTEVTVVTDDDEEDEEEVEAEAEPAPKRTRQVTQSVQVLDADIAKATLLASVLMRHSDTEQGVLIKDSVSGQWKEDPTIVEQLSVWTVWSVKARPNKTVSVLKLPGAALTLDFQHQSRPRQAKTGQFITLSPVASDPPLPS